ncbi:TolB family protein [Amycolatopsis sp. NPDC005003]
MRSQRTGSVGLVLCAATIAALVPGGMGGTAVAATAPATTLISVGVDGKPGTGASGEPSVSADGRYVAFRSSARNLVGGDTNGVDDVFVRDRVAGVTTRVSVDRNGVQGNGDSWAPSISADGRYVAFVSFSTNLAPGDTNLSWDVFVHDRLIGWTSRVSGGFLGAAGNGHSFNPAISADGRFIAYDSYASNLVDRDTNGVQDVFEYDQQTDRTIRVSVDSDSLEGRRASQRPSISADGRYVTFESDAVLTRTDTNQATDVYVHDKLTGLTDRVSVNAHGDQGQGASNFATMSADGRYVAYQSVAENLLPNPGDTNGQVDNFLVDRQTSTVTRLNVLYTGAEDYAGTTQGVRPSISADGRYTAFDSFAWRLVPFDRNSVWDVFVRDRDTATTTRASVAGNGTEGNGNSATPSISADGKHVAFQSVATNFATGTDMWTPNVYLRDLG